MILELKIASALCWAETFVINGIVADSNDFGEQADQGSESAEPYCCGDMQFTRIPCTQAVLGKYGITEAEYAEICDKLEEGLSFGSCGWCE